MNQGSSLERKMSYQVLVDDLKNAISTGQISPGMPILPERSLARKYKLSMGTIRKGIKELADCGMLEKIHGKGSFVSGLKKERKKSETLRIAFIVPTLQVSYYAAMTEEAETTARIRNCAFQLVISADDSKILSLPGLAELDGVICAKSLKSELFTELKKLCPSAAFFFVDGNVPGLHEASATCDDFLGGQLATEHLIQEGCRRIIHLHGSGNSENVNLRRDGYIATMLKNGLQPEILASGIHFADAVEAVGKMLHEKKDLPDGIFCPTDMAAMGAITALVRHGIKIPEQTAVIGYSNLLEAQRYYPTVSSIELDIPGIVKYAFNEIITQIENPASIKSQVRFTPKLRIRESSDRKRRTEAL